MIASRMSLFACLWVLAGVLVVMSGARQFMIAGGISRMTPSSRSEATSSAVPKRAVGDQSSEPNVEVAKTAVNASSAFIGAAMSAAMIGLIGMGMAAPASAAPPKTAEEIARGAQRITKIKGIEDNSALYAAGAAVVGIGLIPGFVSLGGGYVKRESPIEAYMTGISLEAQMDDQEKGAKKAKAKAKAEAGGKPTAKKVNLDSAPSGNSLASALKYACDALGGCYAIYWIPVGGKFVAAGDTAVGPRADELRNDCFAQKHCGAETGKGSLIQKTAEAQKSTFIADASKSPDKGRSAVWQKYGMKSVNMIPFDGGAILEVGSDIAWAKPPESAPIPLNGMREAYEGYGSTYSLFWTKNAKGDFTCTSDFVTPARQKALRNRRGDDKTFANQSKGLVLGPGSMIGQVAASGKEAFLQDAPEDPKFTRASLAKEFGVKSIRVIACEGGVLEYGIPKDEQLAGNTLDSMLKMKCDIAGMDFAIYWVEDGGKFVVAGDYSTEEVKKTVKAKRGNDKRFETECETLKLDASNLKVGFSEDASNCPNMGRAALCKDYGIKTICQVPVLGGVLEYGTMKQMSVAPAVPALPEKELKVAFDDFGAVYTLLWIRRSGKWTVEGDYTTPERIATTKATRTDGKTYGSECQGMKLADNSVVGTCASSKQTDVIYGADSNRQFTRKNLAKDHNIQTVRFVPCSADVVLECGTSERKVTNVTKATFRKEGKKNTDFGAAMNMKRLREDGLAAPTGFMTPYVDAFKIGIGDDFIIETRKNWIQDHTKFIGQGLKALQGVWLQPVFSQFDLDGDGSIDREEFGNYIETLSWGKKPDKAKIDKIYKNYDPAQTGKISISEFADACPSFIKKSMIKLASKNGKGLGLMV